MRRWKGGIGLYSINQAYRIELPDLDIRVERHPSMTAIPMHCHDYSELELVMDGEGVHICNGVPFPLRTGCLYLLTPSDFHKIQVERPLTLFNLSFDQRLLSQALLARLYNRSEGPLYAELDGEMLPHAVSLLTVLEKTNSSPKTKELLQMRICLLEAVIRMLLLNAKKPTPTEGESTSPMLGILLHLHQHFLENPRLSEISRQAGLNPSYVSRRFKELFGASYIDYLTHLKINYAKTLLLSCDRPVVDICYASGFNSLSNFMSAFKRLLNLTPSQYRALHRPTT